MWRRECNFFPEENKAKQHSLQFLFFVSFCFFCRSFLFYKAGKSAPISRSRAKEWSSSRGIMQLNKKKE